MSEHFEDPDQILRDMIFFYEFSGKRRRRRKGKRGSSGITCREV
jgi:hypothetical protein